MKGYQSRAGRQNPAARNVFAARLPVVLLALLAVGCGPARQAAPEAGAVAHDSVPGVMREFRGVWVASVSNIDWPSEPGLPVEQQRAELLAILDRAAALRFNAVILQVRPAADALYASEIEPWSEYLTGEAGRAPAPLYDPLRFAVTEAHRRGLELHAWFNPYRARHPSARTQVPAGHIKQTRPDLVWEYGRHLWMDPGEPEVQNRTFEVILDVVRRYDIDGVHLDDYFYPYRETDLQGNAIPFPDSASYARYRSTGGKLDRHDWRRHSVDALIERLYAGIKAEKSWVKFGISPFGVWRPGHPRGIGGFDAYSELYADARKWLRNGWVDYFTPQLYWQIGRADVSYPVLLRWWVEQNREDRHLWPGNFTSRWTPEEVLGQVFVTRGMPGASGNVHFSMRSLMPSVDSVGEALTASAYAEQALVPASPWLGSAAPEPPAVSVRGTRARRELVLEAPHEDVWLWTVRSRGTEGWSTEVLPVAARVHTLDLSTDVAVVTAVSRTGVESEPVTLTTTAPAGAGVPDQPISRP